MAVMGTEHLYIDTDDFESVQDAKAAIKDINLEINALCGDCAKCNTCNNVLRQPGEAGCIKADEYSPLYALIEALTHYAAGRAAA